MASTFLSFLLLISLPCSFLFILSESHSQPTSNPNLLVIQLHKDPYSGLHWANVDKRTPEVQLPFLVVLNGRQLWLNCDQCYHSTTYQAPVCHSIQCPRANPLNTCHNCLSAAKPGCHNNTCSLLTLNPVTKNPALSELAQDVLAVPSKPGPMIVILQFLFACTPSTLVQNALPPNIQGVLGLGHAPISLPRQLSSNLGLQRQFTICLSGQPKLNGALLMGTTPNNLLPLLYTPLFVSSKGKYYILVTTVRIHSQLIPLNPTLYVKKGLPGALLSTANSYALLQHNFYESVSQASPSYSTRGASAASGTFGMCFDPNKIMTAIIPTIELVLDKPNVVWRLYVENTTVDAKPGVKCLAFVDGGSSARAAVVLGTRQLENFLRFDLATSNHGFSSSLLVHHTKCSDLKVANAA